MTQEIGQLDDLRLQPLITDTQPKRSEWTDIGEAQITHTIFGRAKVRIIRKKDKIRRALLLTTLAALVVTTAIWQGWVATQRIEPQQGAVIESPMSAAAPPNAPATQPAPAPLPAIAPAVKNKPAMPLQTEIKNTAIAQKNTPPQTPMKASEPVAAKPITAQPLPTLKPQATSTATTAITPPPEPPAANSPEAGVPPITETPPPQSPADDPQQAEPVGEPGK